MDQAEVTHINKFLGDNFGKIDGRLPVFRLTWSTFETEYVFGSGRIHKYIEDKNRWILERICEAPLEILPERMYTYEPFWVFKHEDGTYQEPNEKAIVFLVTSFLYSEVKKLTNSDLEEMRLKGEAKEVEVFMDIMEEEYPVTSALREYGERVSVQGLRKEK